MSMRATSPQGQGILLHDNWEASENTLFNLQKSPFSECFLDELRDVTLVANDLLSKILFKLKAHQPPQDVVIDRQKACRDIHRELGLSTAVDNLFVKADDPHRHMLSMLVTRLDNIKKRMNNETHFDSYLNSIVESGIVKLDQLSTEVAKSNGNPGPLVPIAVAVIEQLEHSWNFTNVKELHEHIDERIYDHIHDANQLDHINDNVFDPAKLVSEHDIVVKKVGVYQLCMHEVVEKVLMIGRSESEFKPRPGQAAKAKQSASNGLKHHLGHLKLLIGRVKDDLHVLDIHRRKFTIQSATKKNHFTDEHLTRQKKINLNQQKSEATIQEIEVLNLRLQALAEERKAIVTEAVSGAQQEAIRVEKQHVYVQSLHEYETALRDTLKRSEEMVAASAHLADFIEDVCSSLSHYYSKAQEKLTELSEIVHMENLRYFRKLYKHLTPHLSSVMCEMDKCKQKIASANETIMEGNIDELRQYTHVEVLNKREASKRFSKLYEQVSQLRKVREKALETFKPSADALRAAGYLFASPDEAAPIHLMSMHKAFQSLTERLDDDSDSDSDDQEEDQVLDMLLKQGRKATIIPSEAITGIPLPMSPHRMKLGKLSPKALKQLSREGSVRSSSPLDELEPNFIPKPPIPLPTRDGVVLQPPPDPNPRKCYGPRLLYGSDPGAADDDEYEPETPPKARPKVLWSAFAAAASLGTAPTERMGGWSIGHAREKRLQRRAKVMNKVGLDNLEAMDYNRKLDEVMGQRKRDKQFKLKKERDYRLLQSLRQEIHEQELAQWDQIIELLHDRTYAERKLLMFSKLHKREVFLHGDDTKSYLLKKPLVQSPRPPPPIPLHTSADTASVRTASIQESVR